MTWGRGEEGEALERGRRAAAPERAPGRSPGGARPASGGAPARTGPARCPGRARPSAPPGASICRPLAAAAFLEWAAGTLTGAVAAGVACLPTQGGNYNVWPVVLGVVVGSVAAVNGSALVAARSVEAPVPVDVTPAAFRAPLDEAGAGLRSGIGL